MAVPSLVPDIPVNEAVLWDAVTLNNTNEVTSGSVRFVGVRGQIFYIKFTGGEGCYCIDVMPFGSDEWCPIAQGSVQQDQLCAIDIDFYVPKARVRFEPDASATFPSQISVSAYGYPTVFKSPTRSC